VSAGGASRSGLAWLESRPNFELRSPAEQAAESFPLERPTRLIERLGRPERSYGLALIAGTKGKGSTAVLLGSILRAHGQRVGLYTQPHLHSLGERLRVDGQQIDEAELDDLLIELRPIVEQAEQARADLGRLTAYEILTALGLLWFSRRQVDYAVLEVGLGGRLDATNVVVHDVALITPISYDHMHVLGPTLPRIAAEKAGIIKPRGRVVSAPQRPAALRVIRRVCRERGARLTVVGQAPGPRAESVVAQRLPADGPDFADQPLLTFDAVTPARRYPRLSLQLGGEHQVTNALTALAAAEILAARGLILDAAAVRSGLASARWAGRLEIARTRPLVVVDGAHNGDSAERLREALELHFAFDRLLVVLGAFADKDLPAILRPFKDASGLYAVEVEAERARSAYSIAQAARRLGIVARSTSSVANGIQAARGEARLNDLICVTGSLAVVAAAREALRLPLDVRPFP
jgi:dihydrofolate synthase / folylpolyglutamate synthase